MSEKVLTMFNSINSADYLISNPYSSSCNKVFKSLFKSEEFLDKFYFMSNKTYERLATITALSKDKTKNTVFITGFRGCGKTCFMNLLSSIISGKYMVPSYMECKKEDTALVKRFYDSEFDSEYKKEIAEIEENYNVSERNIINELRSYLLLGGYELNNESISQCINNELNGEVIFLNFDKGNGKNDKKPFEEKFMVKIEQIVEKIIQNRNKFCIKPFAELYDFYQRNSTIIDELLETDNNLLDFFEFVEEKLIKADQYRVIQRELKQYLKNFNLEQDIFILILFYIAYNIGLQTEKGLFFLLDNMDIVYKSNVLDQSMQEYSSFIEDMNSLIQDIDAEAGNNYLWVKYYEQANFIFAMRETTKMQIADQFLDRFQLVAKYFDISLDTDKAYVVEKKFNFIDSYRERIVNQDFLVQMDCIHKICTDVYIKKNIFPMFNNDFKRSILCIAEICKNNTEYIQEKLKLLDTNKNRNKNGARGILFRLIYDEFKKEHYFDDIGVEGIGNRNKSFTPSRIILTVLYNLIPEYERNEVNANFEAMNPTRISLHRLYDYVKPFMSVKTFVHSLIGMYNLKNAKIWNHLITFDNIKEVTDEELEKLLSTHNRGRKNDVMIRITCAGTNYIKFVCTHYEFFACRFTKRTVPLFCESNSTFSDENKTYQFEYVIERVYKSVENCCEHLVGFNMILSEMHADGVLEESEYIFKNKGEKEGKFHEERIIHRHITYLDNYRRHLINDVYPNKVIDINEKIIKVIKKYIQLLDNSLFGEMSKSLIVELMYCVEYIEGKNYDDKTTEISRDAYKMLMGEKENE